MGEAMGKGGNIRILTVCQRGNTRSASLAYLLKDELGYDDVIACGIQTTKFDTFEMLANWAEKIFVVAGKDIWDQVPKQFKKKAVNIDIGGDRWGNPRHPELLALLQEILMKEKLL